MDALRYTARVFETREPQRPSDSRGETETGGGYR